ncbi:hypothetical protein DPSP01_006667 [Paraphaeosphaeria sporulosa]
MAPADHGSITVVDALACDNLWENMVHLVIGSEAKPYRFFKNVLCAHSPVLASLIDQGEGGIDCVIDMKKWSVGSFRIYAHWAFSKRLPEDHREWWHVMLQDHKIGELCLLERLQACVFGREMGMHAFANACYNSYVTAARISKLPPSYEAIAYAFENISKNDNLLSFLVDMYVFHTRVTRSQASGGSSGTSNDKYTGTHSATRSQTFAKAMTPKDLPKDFLVRVMQKTQEMAQGTFAGVMYACAYHIHPSDEERNECPSYILDIKDTPFRLLGDAVVKALAETRQKTTHGLADAVFRVAQLVTVPANFNNGQLLVD